jgi:hypothetical protein
MAGATYNYILNEDGQSYSITCKNPTIVDWATIPTVNTADNLPVTRIGDNAFKNCPYLVTVTIGDNITEIGNSAFENCVVLKRINLINGILIEDNIVNIGNNAFAGCTALEKVFITNGNVSIGNNAFAGCTALADMIMLSMTPNNIGENVFDNTPNATIWVYQECESAYKEASGWVTYADKIEGNNNLINFILAGTKITETYLPYPSSFSNIPSYRNLVCVQEKGKSIVIPVFYGSHGLTINTAGSLSVAAASEAAVKAQSNYWNPICPRELSLAVVVGLTENKNTLTDEQKASAQTWLGIKKLYRHRLSFLWQGAGYWENYIELINSTPTAFVPPDDYTIPSEVLKAIGNNKYAVSLENVCGYNFDPENVNVTGVLSVKDGKVVLNGIEVNLETREIAPIIDLGIRAFIDDTVTEI